ncbi:MAG: PAS domain-containing sensor histidine kinase [Chloroflexota bacterium]|nr:PAS domain-containing sensor histidine kinase [Chloroflexota bacterium]
MHDIHQNKGVTLNCEIVEGPQVEGAVPQRNVERAASTPEGSDGPEDLFAKAFRVSPAALWISELVTGLALDVNSSFLRITGYTRDEVIGQTTISLGLWADKDARNTLVDVLLSQGHIRDMELQFQTKWGEVREGLFSAEIADIEETRCLLVSCTDITERKRAVDELDRYAARVGALLEEVSTGKEALRGLSRRLLEIQESERRHIARELHDEVGQTLTAIQINIETLQRAPEASSLQPRLQESVTLVEYALQQVRNLSLDLRPSLLDDLGLVSALLWYAERQSERTGTDIQVVVNPLPTRLPPDIETACFRIVQEALTNVARHSDARQVRVELSLRDDTLEAAIHDDGAGFDVGAARKRASGGASMGLLGMSERAELVGGHLTIVSELRKGSTVKALLPFTTAAREDLAASEAGSEGRVRS